MPPELYVAIFTYNANIFSEDILELLQMRAGKEIESFKSKKICYSAPDGLD